MTNKTPLLTAASVGKAYNDEADNCVFSYTFMIKTMINDNRFVGENVHGHEVLFDASGQSTDGNFTQLFEVETEEDDAEPTGTFYLNLYRDAERGVRAGRLHPNIEEAAKQRKCSTYLKTIPVTI